MKSRKVRADGQLTALAGEFLVAGELARRGLQVSVTFGNAKAIDLFAHDAERDKTFKVQVKSLRKPNFFPLSPDSKIPGEVMYVFVLLNAPTKSPRFFVVPGKDLAADPNKFGKWYAHYKTFPGIGVKYLTPYEENWRAFFGGKECVTSLL